MIEAALARHLRDHEEVANLLADDEGIKVFLTLVPQGVEGPAAVVTRISSRPDYGLSVGEIGDLKAIVQVSVFAATALDCQAISETIRLAISGYSGLIDDVVVHAIAIESETGPTSVKTTRQEGGPLDARDEFPWMQTTDYGITYERSVTRY